MEIGFPAAMVLFIVYVLEVEFDTTVWALMTIPFLGSVA
jgi:hypothetical protein